MLRSSASSDVDWRAEYAALVDEVRIRFGLSVKAMAITAGCTETQLSEGLKGQPGRNIAAHWILAQSPEFVAEVQARIDRRLGLSDHARRAASVDDICELLRRILMHGERRPAERRHA